MKGVANDDSDEITSVTETDEDESSRFGGPRHISRSNTLRRVHELQLEETSYGPSEGEAIYRVPFDSVLAEQADRLQFDIIEECDESRASARSNQRAHSPRSLQQGKFLKKIKVLFINFMLKS